MANHNLKPVDGCEECDFIVDEGLSDTACLECRLYADAPQPSEELTPEGIQYVLPGAERETTPSKEKEQGSLW